ncbi:MAG: ABC transporter ATP-binding protein [Cardiobacteriaceae bacterium]|nr:ABC transporter ATP-binding protein [Cardiobacteriaceae bacterium]
MNPILSAEHLAFRRGRQQVLRDTTLTLQDNEIVALIGGNGAGKTTLLEILIGALQADYGRLFYRKNLPRFWLGYLPDKAPLYPQWRVSEFLQMCAKIRHVQNEKEAVALVLERCGLHAVAHKRCAALSHGYRQRVGLAQAMIHQPPLLILDEPTNGLDSDQRMLLRPLLSGLAMNSCVLMTSHDWDEVLAIAHRVYYLQDGILHELIIPRHANPQLWVAYESAEQAQIMAQDATLQDGRFAGFVYDGSHLEYQDLWKRLSVRQGVIAFYPSYPREAFQENIDHVARASL